MKIYIIGNIDKEIEEKLKSSKNNIMYKNIVNAVVNCIFGRGKIIYSKEKNNFLELAEKVLKIPYLYGRIENILEFQNHYAKIKKCEVPVLMYHQFVKKAEDGGKIKLFVTEKQFEIQLKILKFLGYKTITFNDLMKIGLENRFDKKYIIITVDDGYKDNYEILFPMLKKYNMKAVIFLVSNLKYNKWTMESDNEKKFMLMSDEEVREMQESGYIEFGGHTLSHISFLKASDEEAEKEIFEDKKITEKRLEKELNVFAYPYGHRKEETKEMVKKAGYKFAVSTDTGSGIFTEDLYDIRRTAIDKTSIFDFLRKISPGYAQYKAKKYKNKRG